MEIAEEQNQDYDNMIIKYMSKPDIQAKIQEMIKNNQKRLVINLDILRETNEPLVKAILSTPMKIIPIFEKNLTDMAAEQSGSNEKIKEILEGKGNYSVDPRLVVFYQRYFSNYFKKEIIAAPKDFFRTVFSMELTESIKRRTLLVITYHNEAFEKICLNYRLDRDLSKPKTNKNKPYKPNGPDNSTI